MVKIILGPCKTRCYTTRSRTMYSSVLCEGKRGRSGEKTHFYNRHADKAWLRASEATFFGAHRTAGGHHYTKPRESQTGTTEVKNFTF